MPFGDGTGPLGMGPRTGRGAGFCAGFGMPGYANRPFGFGWAAGGRGRGWRHWYWATGLPGWARAPWGFGMYGAPRVLSEQEELDALKAQAAQMEQTLEQIRQRMDQLQSSQK